MTVNVSTVSQTPDPDKTTLPPPAPTGTIYMFSTWDKLETNYNTNTPELNPEPSRYFNSIHSLLQTVKLPSEPFPQYVGTTANEYCTIFKGTDAWNEPYYIYVWAIAPAGGAA
jgi:hypothetical protein